jgi:hypothetical protein
LFEHLEIWCWGVAARMPLPLPASQFHDAALRAAQFRRYRVAEILFERSACLYRRELQLERLAHTRIHQLFVRLAAIGREVSLMGVEAVDQRLQLLRRVGEAGTLGTMTPAPAVEESSRRRDTALWVSPGRAA